MKDGVSTEDETIRRLSSEGRSAFQIAIALGGGWSRNAVAERLERLTRTLSVSEPVKVEVAPVAAPVAIAPQAPAVPRRDPRLSDVSLARDWTPDEDAIITDLWVERGLSAADIASALTTQRSRNMVIGRLYRLGLNGRKGHSIGERAAREKPPGPSVRRNARPIVVKPKQPSGVEVMSEPGLQPLRLPLENLGAFQIKGPNQCRYAVNDDTPFLFCALTTEPGKPWCKHHEKIAVVPIDERRRKSSERGAVAAGR